MKTEGMKKWKAPKVIFSIFFVFIVALFVKYCYLALFPSIYGIDMQEFAANRNTYSTALYSKRGTIYDNDSNILALDISSYTVIAYLDESRTGSSTKLYHVADKKKTAEVLAPILNMEASYIEELLNSDAYQVELGPGGRGITEIIKAQVEELDLPGIDFIESYKRYYPNGNFASYIVGYAKQKEEYVDDNGKQTLVKQIVGELGIEVKFDEILKGINGYHSYQQDRFGYKIPDTWEDIVPASNGQDIYLTIDSSIQRLIESTISEAHEKYETDWITITVMDAKTGDILGSSSTPSFDPNVLDITNYENPLTSFVYEPGSVMKIFTYMCAIEKGTYRGDDTFLSGTIDIEGTIVKDWNNYGWGTISYDYGFQQSSNVGVSYLVQKYITKNDLKDCFTKYGFGQVTNIDLPRELSGSLIFNYPVEVAAASFGQGISTTPIQHLQALTLIANNGKMLQPNIIKKIVDTNTGKVVYEREVKESEQIIKQSTVDKLKELMYNTINDTVNGATGTKYIVEGLDVIGKTGTGQIFDNEAGKYLTGWNDFIYSFSGIFPKDDPEIIVFASMKRPNTGSSYTLGYTVQPLMESIAKYLGMISGGINGSENSTSYELTNYTNKNVIEVTENLESNGLKVLVLGDGEKIIDQFPKVNNIVLTGDTVYLLTNSNEIKMPNLKNWSRLEAISLLKLINLSYNVEGYGSIIEQSIEPGTIINFNDTINLKLEQKYNFNSE